MKRDAFIMTRLYWLEPIYIYQLCVCLIFIYFLRRGFKYIWSFYLKFASLKSSRDPVFLLIMAKQNLSFPCTFIWLQELKLSFHSLLEALIPIRPVLQRRVDEFWLIQFGRDKVWPYVSDTGGALVVCFKCNRYFHLLLSCLSNFFVSNKHSNRCFWNLVTDLCAEEKRMFKFEWFEGQIKLWSCIVQVSLVIKCKEVAVGVLKTKFSKHCFRC